MHIAKESPGFNGILKNINFKKSKNCPGRPTFEPITLGLTVDFTLMPVVESALLSIS